MKCSWTRAAPCSQEAKYSASVWDSPHRVASVKEICPMHLDFLRSAVRNMRLQLTATLFAPEIPEELC